MSGPISEPWEAERECPKCGTVDEPKYQAARDRDNGGRWYTQVFCDVCWHRFPDEPMSPDDPDA